MPRTKRSPGVLRTPQQARSRRTRERILEAAVACFEQAGFDETTTAQIARRARIAVGSFYGYFRDKRAIVLELLHETIGPIGDVVVKELDPAGWRGRDPAECVRRLIALIVHSQTIRPGVQRIIWERYFKDADFRAAAQSVETRVRAALETLLAALRAEGSVRVSDDATSAFLVHAAVQWITVRLTLGDSGVDVEAAIDATAEMIARFLFRAP